MKLFRKFRRVGRDEKKIREKKKEEKKRRKKKEKKREKKMKKFGMEISFGPADGDADVSLLSHLCRQLSFHSFK